MRLEIRQRTSRPNPDETMKDVVEFWLNGGPVLWALFGLALVIYFPLCTLATNIRRVLPAGVGRSRRRSPIFHSTSNQGALAASLRVASHDRGLRLEVSTEINQRLRHLSVLIHLAPLLGLFGTVNGIYHTFRSLAHPTSTITDLMSSGIAEALITTATGLLIAIPGIFLVQITRQHLALWVNSPGTFPELGYQTDHQRLDSWNTSSKSPRA